MADVEDAVSQFGGHILPLGGAAPVVRFPVTDVDQLDRIKAALEAEGFEVRYLVAYSSG